MRTDRLALVALLAFAVAAGGCKKKEDASSDESAEKDKKSAKKKDKGDDEGDDDGKKKKKGDDEASDDDGKKKKKGDDEGDDDGKKKKKGGGGGSLTGNFEGQEVQFKYGRTTGFGSLRLELSNEKLPCKGGNPSDDAYTLSFELSAGPNGKFFTGYPIGVPVTYNHQRIKLKSTFVRPQFVNLEIDPFNLKEGEHIKGSLSFDHKWTEMKGDDKKDWKYTTDGKFDIEICDDPFGGYKRVKVPLAGEAPEGDVAGKFGSDTFKAKSALVIVLKDYSTKKEYIDAVEFYSADDVDCANHWTEGRKSAYFYLTDVGGAGETTKFEGTMQPAQPWFAAPKGKGTTPSLKSFGYSGGRRAWIKLNKIDFKKGATINGEVFAESAPDSKPEDSGKIGGHFSAKVCNSGW
ncbi:MAG: hypothetical protein HYV09_23470 [Deltaproteobacteria bacterium]|nr:hypothetical protein [Deltaproteobacteria bacterium]